MSAVGVTKSKLADQRFVIFGAGSAGLGIARQLRDGIVAIDGLAKDEANKQFFLIDRYGLIKSSLGAESKIRDGLQEFVRPDAEWEGVPKNDRGEVELLEVVKKVRPTVLIGCSTKAGAFTEDVVREMAKGTERPIILPLSNPSKLHEVTPQAANDWTEGKALLATGSPFPPCKQPNGKDYVCVFSLDLFLGSVTPSARSSVGVEEEMRKCADPGSACSVAECNSEWPSGLVFDSCNECLRTNECDYSTPGARPHT